MPDDIAVIAVDNPPWAELLDPPLTVLAQPIRAMATRAIELLIRRLQGERFAPGPRGTAAGADRPPLLRHHGAGLARPARRTYLPQRLVERAPMARIALATASDGRDFVHEEVGPFGLDVQDRLAAALREQGHEVLTGEGDLSSNADAVRLGRELAAARPGPDADQLPGLGVPALLDARSRARRGGPLALFSNIDPQYPGMVGMLAAGGGLDQVGPHAQPDLGRPGRPGGASTGSSQLAAAAGVTQGLRGTTFGRIGGRPMGMYTAVANTDQWMAKFGIDVEEIDQYELVRRGSAVDPAATKAARLWLEQHAGGVHYDGAQADARAAGAPDPLVLRDARADRRVAPGLLRHQGPARDDQQLVHDGRRRGVPQRPLRLGRAQGARSSARPRPTWTPR